MCPAPARREKIVLSVLSLQHTTGHMGLFERIRFKRIPSCLARRQEGTARRGTRPRTTPSMEGIEDKKFLCEKPPTGIEFPACANFQADGHGLQSNRGKKE